MPLLNLVTDGDSSRESLGMDSTSPLTAIPEGYVREAFNARIGLNGGYLTRGGYINYLLSAFGSRSITAGIEFRTPSIPRKLVAYATDGTATGGILAQEISNALSSFKTGLSGTARPSLIQFKNLLLFFNGSDSPGVWDGVNYRQMGVTAPASAPTASQTTGGSLTQTGSYIGAYTYYNSVTGAESSPSALSSSVVLTGTNSKITWTVLAGDSSTADTIRLYRTVANGNQLFLDTTAAISATSIDSTNSDSALGQPMELDNSRLADLTSEGKYPVVVDQRIFVASGDNEIRFSKIGQEGPMPESFEAAKFLSIMGASGANDRIRGLGSTNGQVVVIKEHSIGRLDPTGIPDYTIGTDSIVYNFTEISKTVGGISHWAGTEVLNEYIFLGRDNIYATDGSTVRPVANSISATIRTLGFSSSQIDQLSAINDVKRKIVKFQVFSSSSATAPDWTLVGDYTRTGPDGRPFFRWTIDRPGTDSGINPGIKIGCFFQITNTTDGTLDVVAGNTELNGQIYTLESGDSDNTSGIYFLILSRPYNFSNALASKLVKRTAYFIVGNGGDYNLSLFSIYDLSGDEENPKTENLSAGGAIWDIAIWDNSQYTFTTKSVRPRYYHVHRKCNYYQIGFKVTTADSPVTVYEWTPTASIFPV